MGGEGDGVVVWCELQKVRGQMEEKQDDGSSGELGKVGRLRISHSFLTA